MWAYTDNKYRNRKSLEYLKSAASSFTDSCSLTTWRHTISKPPLMETRSKWENLLGKGHLRALAHAHHAGLMETFHQVY